jgi:hypothetical protein
LAAGPINNDGAEMAAYGIIRRIPACLVRIIDAHPTCDPRFPERCFSGN